MIPDCCMMLTAQQNGTGPVKKKLGQVIFLRISDTPVPDIFPRFLPSNAEFKTNYCNTDID